MRNTIASRIIEVSIHAPHTEGDAGNPLIVPGDHVSIHAPHTEGDQQRGRGAGSGFVSIHAPHTEGDPHCGYSLKRSDEFQSTPPTRRATQTVFLSDDQRCFNPRPPHGGRRCVAGRGGRPTRFNPRPPHGGRRVRRRLRRRPERFNPRPPHGGRRATCANALANRGVSIHAPHTEGDLDRGQTRPQRQSFNPRPPHGGRPLPLPDPRQ